MYILAFWFIETIRNKTLICCCIVTDALKACFMNYSQDKKVPHKVVTTDLQNNQY